MTWFEIVAVAIGSATLTATLGEFQVEATTSVVRAHSDISILDGGEIIGSPAQFIYELDGFYTDMVIRTNGLVVGDMIATMTSDTPEVVSVPESVVIPNHSLGESFSMQLH